MQISVKTLIVSILLIFMSSGFSLYAGFSYAQLQIRFEYEQKITTLENTIQELNSTNLELLIKINETEVKILELSEKILLLNETISKLNESRNNESMPINNVIDIGVIASTSSAYSTYKMILEKIIEPDVNSYCQKIGYNKTFKFILKNANEAAATHLEKVQEFKSQGINLLIGGGWSSMASASLPYINSNNMLLISPSSTSPLLAIQNDNLFRMCPDDTIQAPVIAKMLWSWGIKAVVVIQRGDAWADGIFNVFRVEYPKRGGVILERIRYAAEVMEFSSYLQTAETKIKDAVATYGKDHVGIELIAFDTDGVTVISQAKDYPTIYSLKWFGSDGTALSSRLVNEVPAPIARLNIFSPLASTPDNTDFREFSDRYFSLTGLYPGFYDAALYDACWLYALAIINTNTTDTKIIKTEIVRIAENYYGLSGLCKFNNAGDRFDENYDIWGYGMLNGKTSNIKYGYYNATIGQVKWFLDRGINLPG